MPARVGKLPNQGAHAATPACTLNKAAVAVIRSGNPIWQPDLAAGAGALRCSQQPGLTQLSAWAQFNAVSGHHHLFNSEHAGIPHAYMATLVRLAASCANAAWRKKHEALRSRPEAQAPERRTNGRWHGRWHGRQHLLLTGLFMPCFTPKPALAVRDGGAAVFDTVCAAQWVRKNTAAVKRPCMPIKCSIGQIYYGYAPVTA